MKIVGSLGAPALDLAAGFADCMSAWARRGGASVEAIGAVDAAARKVSLATAEGHVCCRLEDLVDDAEGIEPVRAALLGSGMVGIAGDAAVLPLVLDDAGRLYLRRYYDHERRLAAALMRRAASPIGAAIDPAALKARLDAVFGPLPAGGKPDWQRIACALALERRLAVISGGPGTGKTTTVAALLACILDAQPEARIALAAPTGKAAARMLDALRRRAADLPQTVRASLPQEAHTLHRLLGAGAGGRFRHGRDHPLPIDVLVVDEASMLDLALAVRVVEAVPDAARLVLLGDKDQLAAVEAGAVFAELSFDPCLSPELVGRLAAATGIAAQTIVPPAAQRASPLADVVVWLTQSHRFAGDSGIGRLAALVNGGDADAALEWMGSCGDGSVSWIDDGGREPAPATRQRILDGYAGYIAALRRRAGPEDVFDAFGRFRVLCALRDTPRGADAINALVAAHLRADLDHPLDRVGTSPWYPGRPVMVLRNDYGLKLFNGDIGICLPDGDDELMVWFAAAGGGLRRIAPARLPAHDSAFATTVHKAQGSEFEAVLLLLPDQPAKVMVRELIYTAVTRAAKSVGVSGPAEVFRAACARPTVRHAGLIDRMVQGTGS